jgi:hypothetical protein
VTCFLQAEAECIPQRRALAMCFLEKLREAIAEYSLCAFDIRRDVGRRVGSVVPALIPMKLPLRHVLIHQAPKAVVVMPLNQVQQFVDENIL